MIHPGSLSRHLIPVFTFYRHPALDRGLSPPGVDPVTANLLSFMVDYYCCQTQLVRENRMLQGFMLAWFLFLGLSLIFLLFDLRHQPILWVQKLGWCLVTLYTSVFGLFAYLLACRSPAKGLHDITVKALWKQAVNSEVHCVAGDASGIVLAAIALSFFSITNGTEILIEYISAFIFGWFIFQAGMMKNMYANYWQALIKTFFSEMVSMNLVMFGMIPTMVILMHFMPASGDPLHASFWFRMGMATCVGCLTAYPINYYLVKNNLKHGCMTVAEDSAKTQADMTHAAHQHAHMAHEPSAKGHDEQGGEHHQMGAISLAKQILYAGASFVAMAIAIYLTAMFVPIGF